MVKFIAPICTLLLATSSLAFAQDTHVTPIKNPVVAQTPAEDNKVTESIKTLINNSSNLSKLNVTVNTHKGIVTLEGDVDSDAQVISLTELSESVIGVKDVNVSKLKVKDSQEPVADALTTAKIKGLFIREELFGEKDLATLDTSVETKNGVVFITGVVDNKEQIDNAIEIIKKNIPEVKKVEYNVKKMTSAKQ
jgi:hyperosmotically inducible protein